VDRKEEAAACARKMVELHPDWPHGHSLLANILDGAESEAAFARAVALDPHDIDLAITVRVMTVCRLQD